MPDLRRRNTLIGLGTIVLGASGFVVSGAFELGSEGSVGSEWIQVASANQAIPPGGQSSGPVGESGTGDGGDDTSRGSSGRDGDGGGGDEGTGTGSDGDGGAGEGGEGTDGDDEDGDPPEDDDGPPEDDEDGGPPEDDGDSDEPTPDPTPEPTPDPTPEPTPDPTPEPTPDPTPEPTPGPETTRVQVVTDPDNDGNYVNQGGLQWEGQMAASETVVGDEDGFFERFTVANANRNAVSRVGLVDERGYPGGRIAFLVANVGNPDTPGRGGRPVEVVVDLLDGDGDALASTAQLNFPYRVVGRGGGAGGTRGADLVEETVTLPVGGIVEVVIEVDSTGGTDDAERVATLVFAARGVGTT